MKKILAVCAAVLMGLLMASAAYAGCGGCGSDSDGSGEGFSGSLSNSQCPVTGEEVDDTTPYRTTYMGREIGFTDEESAKKFDANPEAYTDNLDAPMVDKSVE